MDDGSSRSEWRLLDTGRNTGRINMEYDLGLVDRYERTGVPVLRFYAWEPYCISLGRNQDSSDIDVSLAGSDGIEIVKRPTGGKAVLHAEELTYSVVMQTGGMSVNRSYNMISSALVHGLRGIGVEASLSQSSADFRKLFRDPSTIPCFSTSAVHEVEYRGRKLVGSAQHRFGDVLLQHGSILFGEYHKNIVRYLNLGIELKEKTRKDLDDHTATLGEILGNGVDEEKLKSAIAGGFTEIFGAVFSPDGGNVRAGGRRSAAPAQFGNR